MQSEIMDARYNQLRMPPSSSKFKFEKKSFKIADGLFLIKFKLIFFTANNLKKLNSKNIFT